jgi:conjugative transfer region protein TrbK
LVHHSEIVRALGFILLAGLFVAVLAMINRHRDMPTATGAASVPPSSFFGRDDLSAELRRCNLLGPKDADDPRCNAVWAESRRRFFMRPDRQTVGSSAAESQATPNTTTPKILLRATDNEKAGATPNHPEDPVNGSGNGDAGASDSTPQGNVASSKPVNAPPPRAASPKGRRP